MYPIRQSMLNIKAISINHPKHGPSTINIGLADSNRAITQQILLLGHITGVFLFKKSWHMASIKNITS